MDLTNRNKERVTRRKSGSVELGTMMFGKVPPQAKDLEEAVLGAIMLEKGVFSVAYEILKPYCFYVESNQRIFKAMYELSEKNQPIDLLTVVEELKIREELDVVGGPYYVTKLTNQVVSAANIERHCRIILQKFIQRELIRISGETIGDAYEDSTDCFDLLNEAGEKIKEVNAIIADTTQVNIERAALSVVIKFADKVERAKDTPKGFKDPNSVFTGLSNWDEINGPMFPALYVVAARPGMGKGVHMTECIRRIAEEQEVGVINGEMTTNQLLIRLGCNIRGIDNFLWKKNPQIITENEIMEVHDAMEAVKDLKLNIEESTYIDKIVNKARLWKERKNVKIIFADFLQMLSVPTEMSRYMNQETDRINYIMEKFRALCKEIETPIVLYSQLNRELYKRGNHEPNLGDLKGSGKIEEYAFQISFLHRPEYFNPQDVVDEFGEDTKGLMYQIIAKHREGELGRLKHRVYLNKSQVRSWFSKPVTDWNPDDETPF